jgi:hypothetical protein
VVCVLSIGLLACAGVGFQPPTRVVLFALQIHRQFRKPLIVLSPKNLLRHPKCKSPLTEFDDVPDDQVREILLVSSGYEA